MKGLIISGTGSGVGKTSITTGLLSKLSHDREVQAYKVGPDFIDPMYHSLATGRQCRNLDTFLVPKEKIGPLVRESSKGSDICMVEGVRGLYEGLKGTTDDCSTAEIAKLLGFPVILVINARSLTRSAAAIINGFKSFDPGVNIAGVILNNVSGEQHENKIREAIEHYCDVEIVGVVKRDKDNTLGQRHLGLETIMSYGKSDIQPLENLVADVDVDRMMDIAERYEVPDDDGKMLYREHEIGMKVAVPMDDAYCFYYRENIECMEAAGMEVKYFSPLAGDHLPDADMYYLGGGYPELYAEKISQNRDFIEGLKNASDEGKYVFGECGGLMTMCSSIEYNGEEHAMTGIFDAKAKMTGRHGPTYVIADTTKDNPIFSDMGVHGHEFHYSELVMSGSCSFGYDILRGKGIVDKKDGLVRKNSMGAYMHQHSLSVDDWMGHLSRIIS